MYERCSSSGGAQDKKKDKGENHKTIKIDGFLSFPPAPALLNAIVLFCRFFLNLTVYLTKLRVLVLFFSDFTDISNVL
jgi:hypothetical protein